MSTFVLFGGDTIRYGGSGVSFTTLAATLPDTEWILAVNPNTGDQKMSDPNGTETPATPLIAVSNLTSSATGQNSINISWSWSGSGQDNFEIERDPGSGWSSLVTLGPSVRSYEDTGLTAGEFYRYRVRATNADGPGPWSTTETSTEQPGTGTPPPSGGLQLQNLYFYENFQGIPVGAEADAHTFHEASGWRSEVVTTSPQPPGGTKSVYTYMDRGSESWPVWGFIHQPSRNGKPAFPRVPHGGEIWTRMYLYYPNNFDWNNNKHVKFWRIHKRRSNGDNDGYLDMYINPNRTMKSITESDIDSPTPQWHYPGVELPHGRWFCYEDYVKLGSTSPGRRIQWIDGQKIDDYSHTHSQNRAGVEIDAFYFHTYVDNGGPATQGMRYCHYAIAVRGVNGRDDTGSMARDADGFPMIGTGVG